MPFDHNCMVRAVYFQRLLCFIGNLSMVLRQPLFHQNAFTSIMITLLIQIIIIFICVITSIIFLNKKTS